MNGGGIYKRLFGTKKKPNENNVKGVGYEIVIKMPLMAYNSKTMSTDEKSVIEIEERDTPMPIVPMKSPVKNVKTVKRKKVRKGEKREKQGGGPFHNFTGFTKKRVLSVEETEKKHKPIYTYVFEKQEIPNKEYKRQNENLLLLHQIKGGKSKDVIKIYKDGTLHKEIVLGSNYFSSIIKYIKRRFTNKKDKSDSKAKNLIKLKLLSKLSKAIIIIKDNSSFYSVFIKSLKQIKNHKMIYSSIAIILATVIVLLFSPILGIVDLLKLIKYISWHLITYSTVNFYTIVGKKNNII